VLHVALPKPLSQDQLWTELERVCPALSHHRPVTRLARNGEYAQQDACFADTDEVALIPPVSGG